MLNVLVTGGNGYIGSQFKKKFSDSLNIDSLSHTAKIPSLNDLAKIDTIVHCAALVHQKKILPYEAYYKANVEFPLALAKQAKQAGVKQFVFLSSIAVYGDQYNSVNEQTECNPSTPYGKSKLEAEHMLQTLDDVDFHVSIIRPPMVYGKNSPGNIASLVKLVNLVRILPFGDLHNKRSFVYIENLLDMMKKLIDTRQRGIFLAADDMSVSTADLCKLIAKSQNKMSILLTVPFFGTVLKRLYPNLHKKLFDNLEVDNTLSKIRLQFHNKFSIEQGISHMFHKDLI